MRKKSFVIATIILSLGVVMLFGTSYSMISNTLVSEKSYSFNVANFDVEFQDNAQITLGGLPVSDEDGLKNSKEFSFTIINNSDFDVNYRLDIIENSLFSMSNVIKYTYSLNNGEYQEINLLSNNYTINQNKVLKKKEKDIYKIKLWLSIDADETYMNKKFQGSIILSATHNENKYATSVIEYLGTNNLDGVQKENDNYRYTSNQQNYVWFNCKDNYTKGDDYCEKWQIIGSFKNNILDSLNEYQMIKLINLNGIEDITFNNDDLTGNYDNSYIKTFANGIFYDKLNEKTKGLIAKAKWNIGNTSRKDFNNAYKDEIKETTYAYVGLLNVTDYLYLKDNNWIKYEDDLFTINKNDNDVNLIGKDGIISQDSKKEATFIGVIYLRPDVSIISGDGSQNNPYELGIKFPMNFGKINR